MDKYSTNAMIKRDIVNIETLICFQLKSLREQNELESLHKSHIETSV